MFLYRDIPHGEGGPYAVHMREAGIDAGAQKVEAPMRQARSDVCDEAAAMLKHTRSALHQRRRRHRVLGSCRGGSGSGASRCRGAHMLDAVALCLQGGDETVHDGAAAHDAEGCSRGKRRMRKRAANETQLTEGAIVWTSHAATAGAHV